MKKFAYSFPILRSEVNKWLAFVEEVKSSRNKEFTEMHARIGVTKESWYLQKTNAGYDVVIYTEARDEKFMENFKNDSSTFSDWFRDEVRKTQDIDLDNQSVLPILVLDWNG
tara:strand:+ start:2471 stop:2806 length:336 start_codon:yes stop_codon:yes gene_type:complete